MNRLLPASLVVLLVALAPAASAQQRQTAPERQEATPHEADRPRHERTDAAAVAPGHEHLLREAERAERYVYDPETGVPTLTPEAAAAFFERHAEARAAARAEAERTAAADAARKGQRQAAPVASAPRGGGLFTVDSAWDDEDENPGDGICDIVISPIPECTLRAAIQEANATPGTAPLRIEFNIFTGPTGSEIAPGVWRIQPNLPSDGFLGPLPFITRENTTVDALTQPGLTVCGSLTTALGFRHVLKVVLDGSLLDSSGNGLVGSSLSDNIDVRGFVVRNFPGYGISVGGPGSLAECNYVGTYRSGEVAAPNADGVIVSGFLAFQGAVEVRNNLVSGNAADGVIVSRNLAEVRDNLIGTDDNGTEPLGNGEDGVFVSGDDVVVDGNVVSANGSDGLELGASPGGFGGTFIAERAEVTSNIVGLSLRRRGLTLGNTSDGVAVTDEASDNDIGLPGTGNYVANNGHAGVFIRDLGTSNNRVRGNTVGLTAVAFGHPVQAAPNSYGVWVGSSARPNTVGGTGAGDGNVIAGNTLDGVLITSTDNDVIGNLIGLGAAGQALPNRTGVTLGTVVDVNVLDNTISGNEFDGIQMGSAFGGGTFVIADNRIGTRADGLAARGNGGDGIVVGLAYDDITIEDNVISANGADGVDVAGSNVVLRGNIVGLAADGSAALGNTDNGILIGPGNIFGAPVSVGEAGNGNVVSANGGVGIYLDRGVGHTVRDNLVGTDASGTLARPNGLSGIALLDATDPTIRDNTISGNTDTGLYLEGASGVVAEDNFIGTNANGDDLGNGLPGGAGRAGVYCADASDVRIGKNFSPNTIAFNGADGIFVGQNCQDLSIVGNIIHSNGGLAVDLAPNGPNPNDFGDGDTGANDKLNFPVITSAENDGSNSVIEWTLNARPNTSYELLFCRLPSPDPSGHGECEGPNALATAATNGSGNASGTKTLGVGAYPAGSWVTANATEAVGALPGGYGPTSEFSAAVEVEDTSTPPGVFLSATNTSPLTVTPGGSVSFAYTITNNTASAVTGDFFYTVAPGGLSAVITSGTVPAGQVVNGGFTQGVPQGTPSGSYTYTLRIGQFPNTTVDSEAFTITVTGAARAGEGPSKAWAVLEASPWQPVAAGAEGTSAETTPGAASRAGSSLPEAVALHAPYPNPVRERTTLGFALPEAGPVRLAVYDLLGRTVAVLVDETHEAGTHEAVFDAAGLPSGTYLVRLEAGGTAQTQRLTLVR